MTRSKTEQQREIYLCHPHQSAFTHTKLRKTRTSTRTNAHSNTCTTQHKLTFNPSDKRCFPSHISGFAQGWRGGSKGLVVAPSVGVFVHEPSGQLGARGAGTRPSQPSLPPSFPSSPFLLPSPRPSPFLLPSPCRLSLRSSSSVPPPSPSLLTPLPQLSDVRPPLLTSAGPVCLFFGALPRGLLIVNVLISILIFHFIFSQETILCKRVGMGGGVRALISVYNPYIEYA